MQTVECVCHELQTIQYPESTKSRRNLQGRETRLQKNAESLEGMDVDAAILAIGLLPPS